MTSKNVMCIRLECTRLSNEFINRLVFGRDHAVHTRYRSMFSTVRKCKQIRFNCRRCIIIMLDMQNERCERRPNDIY